MYLLYIPPENSGLYVSHLRDFDSFDYIDDDIRHFSSIGDVYLCDELHMYLLTDSCIGGIGQRVLNTYLMILDLVIYG